jgi:hypothetical protein
MDLGDLKRREVKTGFCRKRMQTGSSETLTGWKSGKTTMSLYGTEWRELGYGLRCREIKTGFCRKR